MKKNHLYNLYSNLDVEVDTITKCLYTLNELKGIQADLFYNFCINNKDIIKDNNFNLFLLLFSNFDYIYSDEYKIYISDLIHNFFSNDYVISMDEIDYVIYMSKIIISKPLPNKLIYEIDEADYYTYNFLKNYFSLFDSIRNVSYEEMYNHDFKEISDLYEYFLDDLNNTKYIYEEDLSANILKRLDIFSNIANRYYTLNDEKYSSLLAITMSIDDVKKLSIFITRLDNIVNSNISDEDFKQTIDSYSDEVNFNTINSIKEKLLFEEKIDADGYEVLKRKKSLVKSKEKEISKIKKILKPTQENIIRF